MATQGEKSLRIRLLVLTEFTNVTDGQPDGQTPRDGIGRACIASRGKNNSGVLGEEVASPFRQMAP